MPEAPLPRTAPAAISDDQPSPACCDRLARDLPAPGPRLLPRSAGHS